MSLWPVRPLRDVLELQRGHDLPSEERNPGDIPIIGSFGVTGYHDVAKYSGPGVGIGRSGASIGTATYVAEDYWPLNTCLFVKDFKGNDPRWAYWLLDQIDFSTFNSGSAQPSLNRNFLKAIPVGVPPRAEQEAIAEVLGAFDDKVGANISLLTTADRLVRAEYEAIDAPRVRIDEVATSSRLPTDPSTLDPDTEYVGLEHIARRNMWLTDAGVAADVKSAKTRFERGDVLFGKLRPYFHKVAAASTSGICSTDILVLRARRTVEAAYLLAAVSSDAVVREVAASSEGTRMPRTSWKDLSAVRIRWPDDDTLPAITARLSAIRDAAESTIRQNDTLLVMRDALVPQLLTGRMRVRDAEALMSNAGV